MIVIPEKRTVVILNPRCASGSLRRCIARRWSRSFMLYRHAEASLVPLGYEDWKRVCVVRHPVERLWSIYKFLRAMRNDPPAYLADAKIRQSLFRSVCCDFDTYVRYNTVPFPWPNDCVESGERDPLRFRGDARAENAKSQLVWASSGLGTYVYLYEQHLPELCRELDLPLGSFRENATRTYSMPKLRDETREHLRSVYDWEFGDLGYLWPGEYGDLLNVRSSTTLARS